MTELRAQIRDQEQVHEMHLSEAAQGLATSQEAMRVVRKSRRYWQARCDAVIAEREAAAANAREARIRAATAERATRSADLLNLSLRRQLTRLDGAVPVLMHTSVCNALREQLASREGTIEELQAQLAAIELSRAGGERGR